MNFENRSAFAKVMGESLCPFLTHGVDKRKTLYRFDHSRGPGQKKFCDKCWCV